VIVRLVNIMRTEITESKSTVKAKPTGKISYEDFLEWCDEDTRAEWVSGEIIMASPISKRHQDISNFLIKVMGFYIEKHKLGELMVAPFQMKLGDISSREPDLFFVASNHLDRFKDTYLDGPADMAVEIISKESINRDRGEKFIEYETFGIPEYWLIDPIRKQADFYRLHQDGFYHPILPDEEGIYHSEAIPGFWLRVPWLWQEPFPPVMEIWHELGLLE